MKRPTYSQPQVFVTERRTDTVIPMYRIYFEMETQKPAEGLSHQTGMSQQT